jgi:hypothetical protein
MRRRLGEERRRRRERSSMQVGLRCTTLLDGRHWDMNTLMHNFFASSSLFKLGEVSGKRADQGLPEP